MDHEARRIALEDKVCDLYGSNDVDMLRDFTDAELLELIERKQPSKQPSKLAKPIEPRQSAPKPKMIKVEPQSIGEAFVVQDGKLYRRIVTRHILGQFESEQVFLAPTGKQVRFQGRVYLCSHILHYLVTGQWPVRLVKPGAKVQRYRGRVRTPSGLVHLGYFDTEAERDEAVFKFRLGLK